MFELDTKPFEDRWGREPRQRESRCWTFRLGEHKVCTDGTFSAAWKRAQKSFKGKQGKVYLSSP